LSCWPWFYALDPDTDPNDLAVMLPDLTRDDVTEKAETYYNLTIVADDSDVDLDDVFLKIQTVFNFIVSHENLNTENLDPDSPVIFVLRNNWHRCYWPMIIMTQETELSTFEAFKEHLSSMTPEDVTKVVTDTFDKMNLETTDVEFNVVVFLREAAPWWPFTGLEVTDDMEPNIDSYYTHLREGVKVVIDLDRPTDADWEVKPEWFLDHLYIIIPDDNDTTFKDVDDTIHTMTFDDIQVELVRNSDEVGVDPEDITVWEVFSSFMNPVPPHQCE